MIEFNKDRSFFETDEEILEYATKHIDVLTGKAKMSPMEIIDELQASFTLTESEMGACIFILATYIEQGKHE